jgi:hypothetical protein
MTKGAVLHDDESIALDYMAQGVSQVQLICPKHASLHRRRDGYLAKNTSGQERRYQQARRLPADGPHGTPQSRDRCSCSSDRFVTGAAFSLDGGNRVR